MRYARPELFDGATYFLCGTADGLPEAYELLHTFVAGIGARPVAIGVDAHDRIMALVSHVPHVLANIIMTSVGEYEADGRRALFSVGPSFKDLTRVAGANPRMWRDIYLENRDALITSLESVRAGIDEFCAALRRSDEATVADTSSPPGHSAPNCWSTRTSRRPPCTASWSASRTNRGCCRG